MTAISQMQMSYNPEEDRILFRLNTNSAEEFRFWLTRRFCGLLIMALNQHKETDPDVATQTTPDARQAVQEFKREAAQEKGDFKQEFRQSQRYPLGDSPVLAYKLSYAIEGGNLKLSIQPKDGQGINLVLNPTLNHNVSQLLRGAGDKAKWSLDFDHSSTDRAGHVIN